MKHIFHAEEQLYTFKEAMNYLRVSRATLWRLLKKGTLEGGKVGYTWRFTKAQLQKVVQKLEKEAEA